MPLGPPPVCRIGFDGFLKVLGKNPSGKKLPVRGQG